MTRDSTLSQSLFVVSVSNYAIRYAQAECVLRWALLTMATIAIGADEAGFVLKEILAGHARDLGHEVHDFGCYSPNAVDYPDVAERVALAIASGQHERGILVCGTGIGMAIAANKIPGIRAAQAHDTYSAERARKSNDAQVLTLGARVVGPELAKSIVQVWLASEFTGQASPSYRKVRKLIEIDQKYRDEARPATVAR